MSTKLSHEEQGAALFGTLQRMETVEKSELGFALPLHVTSETR